MDPKPVCFSILCYLCFVFLIWKRRFDLDHTYPPPSPATACWGKSRAPLRRTETQQGKLWIWTYEKLPLPLPKPSAPRLSCHNGVLPAPLTQLLPWPAAISTQGLTLKTSILRPWSSPNLSISAIVDSGNPPPALQTCPPSLTPTILFWASPLLGSS